MVKICIKDFRPVLPVFINVATSSIVLSYDLCLTVHIMGDVVSKVLLLWWENHLDSELYSIYIKSEASGRE